MESNRKSTMPLNLVRRSMQKRNGTREHREWRQVKAQRQDKEELGGDFGKRRSCRTAGTRFMEIGEMKPSNAVGYEEKQIRAHKIIRYEKIKAAREQ